MKRAFFRPWASTWTFTADHVIMPGRAATWTPETRWVFL